MNKLTVCIVIGLIYQLPLALSQSLDFEWSEPNTNTYTNNDINICGVDRAVDLKVSWRNDQNCPYPGMGSNRYRWTIKLFKNNSLISTRRTQSSSCWVNEIYQNINVSPGVYKAHITLEVRKWLFRWQVQGSGNAGFINVSRDSTIPAFTINGITPDPEIPIEVCPSKILIDPSGTSCEEKYSIGIWEFDFLNWNRPREYEWNKWFSGEAPVELNLQQLSSQYSYGTDFSGLPSRQGEILYGGNLSNNNPRYYYISLCTSYPEWKCASGVIKVKCDCD